MKNQTGSVRPKLIKLIGELDLDLTKRGIRAGEEFHVYGFEEKTGACHVLDSRIDCKYPFVVWKENYEVLEYLNFEEADETEEIKNLREQVEVLKDKLNEVQGKIERTCPNCLPDEYKSLSAFRSELRKELSEISKTMREQKNNIVVKEQHK